LSLESPTTARASERAGAPVRIRGFDGLRAFAVLAVFLTHRSPLYSTNLGAIGVLLFFVLSGFLVGGILHQERLKIEAGTTDFGAAFRRFMERRTLRIAPIYYLSIAAVMVAAAFGWTEAGWTWDAVPWALAYALNIFQGSIDRWVPPISHFWSLAIEMQFYLLLAPLILTTPSRWHAAICWALIALSAVEGVRCLLAGAPYIAVYSSSLVNFGLLATGALIRITGAAWPWRGRHIAQWAGALIVLLVALAPHVADPASVLLVVLFGAIGSGLLVMTVAQAQETTLIRLLELPFLRYLGQISYGFYVYHALFRVQVLGETVVGDLVRFALNLSISIVLAAASWHFLEKRIINFSHKRTRSGQQPAVGGG
jgi:peptidoglycan/LPS O-acetylase OafA/YrhL